MHLLEAIRINQDSLIYIKMDESFIEPIVALDLSVLGGVELWEAVVKEVRKENAWGKTRGFPITDHATETYPNESTEYNDLASRMWAEKIYGVDREGKQIKKVIKKKSKKGKISEVVTDTTEKYIGKYISTVMERLAFLPRDKAPYWYIIEHGNAGGVPGFEDIGTAYPTVPPSRISDRIETNIKAIFKSVFANRLERVEEEMVKVFAEEFGIKRKGKSFRELDDDIRRQIEDSLKRKPDQPVDIKDGSTTFLGEIKIGESSYLRQRASNGRVFISRRGAVGGRFVKVKG
jgi:hypothetical protein